MLNPILNLPVLIGHHEHPFTKPRIVEESGIVGAEGMDKATHGAPKWPTLDKTKACFDVPAQRESRKPKDNALPLICCFHSPRAQEED